MTPAQPPLLFRRHAAAIGVIVAMFVLWNMDKVWSLSIDLSHHYALAYRIAEQWRLPVNDPSLGAMNIYPWLSHAVVAIAGTLTGSVYTGLQLVALLSVAGVWVTIFGVVSTLPRRQALWTCLAIALLAWGNKLLLGLNLHGTEIVSNYFFSQLAAQALLFAALWSALVIERRRGWPSAVASLALWVQLIAFVHLLPALVLTGVAILRIALGTLPRLRDRTAIGLVAWSLVLVLLIGGSMLLHPSFESTRQIAANDGALDLVGIGYPQGMRLLTLLAALVAGVQVWMAITRQGTQAAVRYIGLYGAAVAGLCILQIVALKLGHGTPYGVKKYGFALITYLLVSGALALAWLVDRATARIRVPASTGQGGTTVLLGGTLAAVLVALVPDFSLLHGADIARVERQLIAMHEEALPPAPAGKSDIVNDLGDMPPPVSYMFSIAILHTPIDDALDDTLRSGSITHTDRYARVLTATESKARPPGACQPVVRGALTATTPECLATPSAPCKTTFDFASREGLDGTAARGFSRSTPGGRWTEGKKASLSCVVGDKAGVREAVLTLTPFMGGTLKSQRVRIAVGSAPPREFRLDSGRELVIPLGKASERVELNLEMPDAASPQSVGHNADTRELGVLVRSVQFR
jgi:hypothetical protein